jgi:hypothetical protein
MIVLELPTSNVCILDLLLGTKASFNNTVSSSWAERHDLPEVDKMALHHEVKIEY